MTDYKQGTIKEIIEANVVTINSFVDDKGHNHLPDVVEEIQTNLKDKVADILNSITASGIGLDSGVYQIFKEVAIKAVQRSEF